jgi:tetratricopeptide (TPR) repeat protein
VIPILFALAAAAAGPSPAQSDESMYGQCVAIIKKDPANAADQASQWLTRGGGLFARQCQGQAFAAQKRWQPAAVAFEQAAREAERMQDGRRADFWAQSGNAWLAADNGAKARAAFDAALAITTLSPELRGEVYLDRARAGVALDDLKGARADLDQGLALVPSDPFAWYISAALAMREAALPRAQKDIAKAVELAPDDADVLLLAGNVAGAAGDDEGARTFYGRAIKAEPGSDAAKSAEAALAANTAPASAAPSGEPTAAKP